MDETDTIVAVATASGMAGVGIVRLSGPASHHIASQICTKKPEPRVAIYTQFLDASGDRLDDGIVLYFPAPNSYTGEESCELQMHGSPIVLEQVVECCTRLGSRLARPGEFTERAFLNDKIDLAQAESVIDLIEARTQAAAKAATRSLEGDFSRRTHSLVDMLISIRVYIESALDFSEEEIDFLASEELQDKIKALQEFLIETLDLAHQGKLLHEGVRIAIAGAPNVGKSSLINRLSGEDLAIVTDIPGTTRDVLRTNIQIDGLPVTLIDTAGLRDSEDPVEQEGIKRARQEFERADRILYICTPESSTEIDVQNTTVPTDIVVNKCDLIANPVSDVLNVSAKTGAGISELKTHIKTSCGYLSDIASVFIARKRHTDALALASTQIETGLKILTQKQFPELAAEEFLQAQKALGNITGAYSSDDLLGEIFSSFCIGK
ncbi:MAG: tRNA uridine-5-carboxymethylaminomethyl(34) synthesis GTPase MnmE [Pseudomonadota bacterium]